jgi:hypothetical protein
LSGELEIVVVSTNMIVMNACTSYLTNGLIFHNECDLCNTIEAGRYIAYCDLRVRSANQLTVTAVAPCLLPPATSSKIGRSERKPSTVRAPTTVCCEDR